MYDDYKNLIKQNKLVNSICHKYWQNNYYNKNTVGNIPYIRFPTSVYQTYIKQQTLSGVCRYNNIPTKKYFYCTDLQYTCRLLDTICHNIAVSSQQIENYMDL